MKEHPILFSGPMVRAILEGRKTQTRRVVKTRAENNTRVGPVAFQAHVDSPEAITHCPHGVIGDRLWVRETWGETVDAHGGALVRYAADGTAYHMLCEQEGEGDVVGHGWKHYEPSIPADEQRWRPSIHMPRWASRITLEIASIRVERVQEISVEDCIAEGLSSKHREHDACVDLIEKYRALWDSLNAKRGFGWDANPWVWVIEFRRIEAAEAAKAKEAKP